MSVAVQHCASPTAQHETMRPARPCRRSSLVRNLCRGERLEATPINFCKPIFLPVDAPETFCGPVQLASLCSVFQSVVGQIICPDLTEEVQATGAGQRNHAHPLNSPPLLRRSSDEGVLDRRVFVRYTVDNWQTFSDIDATFTTTYWPNGSVAWSLYSFKLDTTLEAVGPHTLHFAICVQRLAPPASPQRRRDGSPPPSPVPCIPTEEFWDDNNHQNYSMRMQSVSK